MAPATVHPLFRHLWECIAECKHQCCCASCLMPMMLHGRKLLHCAKLFVVRTGSDLSERAIVTLRCRADACFIFILINVLRRMVDAGEVYAQIDAAASTVRFLQDPERYDSASVVQRLESQMKRAMALGDRIRAVNNKVTFECTSF